MRGCDRRSHKRAPYLVAPRYLSVMELPNASDPCAPIRPDMLPHRDTAARNESASDTSWIVALVLVALTVIAVIVVLAITT